MATRTKTTHAAAAQAIRQDLKKAFPGVKFKVRSSSFSMGNSVDVDWIDGPTRDEVNRIIGRYQYGHFDGMQDLYEYSNRRNDLPQAKFVSGNRSMSEAVRAELLDYVADRFFEPEEREGITENTRMPNGNWWVQEQVWREFAERSYCESAQWMPEEREADEPEEAEASTMPELERGKPMSDEARAYMLERCEMVALLISDAPQAVQ